MKQLIILISLVFILSCKKENLNPKKELPDPYNTEKKQVFGCKLNGEVWLPGANVFAITYYYSEVNGGFGVAGNINNNGIDESLAITAVFKDTGFYKNLQPQVFVDLTGSELPDWEFECAEYFRDTTQENFVHIEVLDTENGIIIGSFEDVGINSCGDTVVITDGRFKTTYK
jgi:hypothetical protein